jgi:hypothetical protein
MSGVRPSTCALRAQAQDEVEFLRHQSRCHKEKVLILKLARVSAHVEGRHPEHAARAIAAGRYFVEICIAF